MTKNGFDEEEKDSRNIQSFEKELENLISYQHFYSIHMFYRDRRPLYDLGGDSPSRCHFWNIYNFPEYFDFQRTSELVIGKFGNEKKLPLVMINKLEKMVTNPSKSDDEIDKFLNQMRLAFLYEFTNQFEKQSSLYLNFAREEKSAAWKRAFILSSVHSIKKIKKLEKKELYLLISDLFEKNNLNEYSQKYKDLAERDTP